VQVDIQHLSFETILYEAGFLFGLQISRYRSVDSYIPEHELRVKNEKLREN
jgi:hypothetical protein